MVLLAPGSLDPGLSHAIRIEGLSSHGDPARPQRPFMFTHQIRLAVLVTTLLSTAAWAQEEHRIQGKSVSPDQLEAVQAQCDAMRQGDDQSPVAAAAAVAPEQSEEAAIEIAGDLWIDGGTEIDLDKLSIETCDEGNFALTKK
jgi:hypothetical protein